MFQATPDKTNVFFFLFVSSIYIHIKHSRKIYININFQFMFFILRMPSNGTQCHIDRNFIDAWKFQQAAWNTSQVLLLLLFLPHKSGALQRDIQTYDKMKQNAAATQIITVWVF
jgi:succinate dehydrogenase hydrophobic anchor subunit